VLVYSQSYSSSITFNSQIIQGGEGQIYYPVAVYAFALWSSYISDPNPIAGLNRREIVVTKTA